MKNILLIILLSSLVHSQQYKLIGPPGGAGGVLNIKIHPTYPEIIYTTSPYNGGFFQTTDGGITLSAIHSPFNEFDIRSIALPKNNKNTIYFCENTTGYFRSPDAGKSWERIITDTPSKKYICLNPLINDIILIKRNSNELWRSNDKGESWYRLAKFDEEIISFDIFPQDTSMIYLATFTQLYKSTNSGKDWFKKAFLPGTSDMQLNSMNPEILYIQTGGRLYKSTDGGETINIIFTPGMEVFKLSPLDTSVLYAGVGYTWEEGGYPSGIYKSTDGGISWVRKMGDIDTIKTGYGSPTRTIEINPFNSDEVYTEIYWKGVFKTTDGGESWIHTNLSFMPVSYLVANKEKPEEIVVGNMGWGIMKTNDGGRNWYYPNFDIKPTIIEPIERSFDFNPSQKEYGYLAGDNYLYKTTNGGDNWFSVKQFDNSVLAVFYHKYCPDTIFLNCIGQSFISADGGNNWEKYTSGFVSFRMRFSKSNPNLLYDYGLDGNLDYEVRKSTNLGKTWVSKTKGLLVEKEDGSLKIINDVKPNINNPDVVYCAQVGGLSKTTNSGDTWFQVDSSLKKLEPWMGTTSILLDPMNDQRIYVGVQAGGEAFTDQFTHGGLYLTEDDCKTWQRVYTGEVQGIYSDEGSPRINYINTNYGIMRFLDTLTVTGIELSEQPTPESFQLFQNYPNPFNPKTRIEYKVSEECNVTIKVYNILGKEISTLVNKRFSSGKYFVDFDGSNFPSGVYIYTINTNDFVHNRKMLLLK